MIKKQKHKGEYGYRDYHRIKQLSFVAFGVVMILVQLLARLFTDNQAARNILTVMAVLSVLPTANLASPLLASWRYKTPSRDFYERIRVHEKDFVILYDLIMTTKEFILPMDAVIVHPKGIFGYCTSVKVDSGKAQSALNSLLEVQKLDPNLKLIKDEKQFFRRIDNLMPASECRDDGSVEYAVRFLKSLSM